MSLSLTSNSNFNAIPQGSLWEGGGSLLITPSASSDTTGSGTFRASGFVIQTYGYGLNYVDKYLGERNVPQDILRLRRQVFDAMRRFGQPVVVKHMFNTEDERKGIARKSPLFQEAYGQVRTSDPYSYGTGYASYILSKDEWISPDGHIVRSNTSPGTNFVQAPKYRGYGPGYLTWVIEPDAAEDIFRLTEVGALIRVQDQLFQAPWFPEINDNDLIINVVLDNDQNIVDTVERFQAKQVTPVSIRGQDIRGRAENLTRFHGNRYVINQQFQASRIPTNNSVLYRVEVDR